MTLALAGMALLLSVAARGLAAEMPSHDPAGPPVRVVLGLVWMVAQIVSFASVFRAPDDRFPVLLGGATALGVVLMVIGRGGFLAMFSLMPFAAVAVIAMLSASGGIWCASRASATPTIRTVWRLFCWLVLTGSVYLYAAHPAEALGHLTSLAGVLVVCAVFGFLQPRLSSLVELLELARPNILSGSAWMVAISLLVGNALWMNLTSAALPQVQFGAVSFAPYFLAVGFVLFAIVLDLHRAAIAGWQRLLLPCLALAVVSGLYVVGLGESGTLSLLFCAALVCVLLVGTPAQVTASSMAVGAGVVALRSAAVAALVAANIPRVGERLLVWSGTVSPQNQLARVLEVVTLGGLLGHAGAARLQFLVGPQVGKDYMVALVVAHGGWIGLLFVFTASAVLILELYRVFRGTVGHIGRAVQVAILSVMLGNLLVTTLWLGGLTPFVGMPLPLVARGGSHLLVVALALLIFEAASTSGAARQGDRRAA